MRKLMSTFGIPDLLQDLLRVVGGTVHNRINQTELEIQYYAIALIPFSVI